MEITYVYQNTESGLFTVGYYNPTGKWMPESDHESSEAAAARVHYLNGGTDDPKLLEALDGLFKQCVMIRRHWGENSNAEEADKAIKFAQAVILKAKGGR